jgi:hypothetical protein
MRRDLDYPFEVKVTGRADRLEPVKPLKAGMRQYLPVIIAICAVILFFIIFALTKLKIHVEVR